MSNFFETILDTLSSSALQISLPSKDIFQLFPTNQPATLPPPLHGSSPHAPLFSIPEEIYTAALDLKIPITFASVYSVSVFLLNAYNSRRGNTPWVISRTRIFSAFVLLHNVLLAIYSGWTFYGMWGALERSIPSPYSSHGLTGTIDGLCKIHGPRGLGQHATYNSTISSWVVQAASADPSVISNPDAINAGRLWNEGLAFYGWLFYLSKFYELLDTFIIIAKGKRSAFLQSYHHTGAMFCMWSGIRYMSPPIWMFVFVNSAIHTLMYTYFALSAIRFPVPQALKRALTTLQIIQFLVGSSYAAIHSFVSYSIPVEVPFVEFITESVAPLAEKARESGGVADKLKGLIITALARPNSPSTPSAVPKSVEHFGTRTEPRMIPCIDSSGETFAIWLNIFYLTPLTLLFMRFFVKSYILPESSKTDTKTDGKRPKENGSAAISKKD